MTVVSTAGGLGDAVAAVGRMRLVFVLSRWCLLCFAQRCFWGAGSPGFVGVVAVLDCGRSRDHRARRPESLACHMQTVAVRASNAQGCDFTEFLIGRTFPQSERF